MERQDAGSDALPAFRRTDIRAGARPVLHRLEAVMRWPSATGDSGDHLGVIGQRLLAQCAQARDMREVVLGLSEDSADLCAMVVIQQCIEIAELFRRCALLERGAVGTTPNAYQLLYGQRPLAPDPWPTVPAWSELLAEHATRDAFRATGRQMQSQAHLADQISPAHRHAHCLRRLPVGE
jgi:hypothetical protein